MQRTRNSQLNKAAYRQCDSAKMVRDGPMWLEQQGRQWDKQTYRQTARTGNKDSKRISADAPGLLCFYAKLAVSDSVNRGQAATDGSCSRSNSRSRSSSSWCSSSRTICGLGRLGLVIFSWHNKEFTIIACKSPVK